MTPEDRADRRARQAQLASDGDRDQAGASEREDPCFQRGAGALGASLGTAAAVLETALAFGLEATDPAPGAGATQAYGLRRTSEGPALLQHSMDEDLTDGRTRSCVSMQLHSGFLRARVA